MSRLDSIGRFSGFAALAAQHGEAATYTPKGLAGVALTVVVNRDPLGGTGTDHGARQEYEFEVLVSRGDRATVNVGGDTIAFKKRLGDAANTTFAVAAVLGQDGGAWRLGVR